MEKAKRLAAVVEDNARLTVLVDRSRRREAAILRRRHLTNSEVRGLSTGTAAAAQLTTSKQGEHFWTDGECREAHLSIRTAGSHAQGIFALRIRRRATLSECDPKSTRTGVHSRRNELMIPNSFFLVPMLLLVILLEPVVAAELKPDQCGLASVYSTDSENTASGEDTQPRNLTAAHRSLPFGTLVRVVIQENGRSAVVRITDRGPFVSGRIIDLSKIAARLLSISGLTQVCLNVLPVPDNTK